jgi:hypothetical protein
VAWEVVRDAGTALDRIEMPLLEALGFALASPLGAMSPLPSDDAAAMTGR